MNYIIEVLKMKKEYNTKLVTIRDPEQVNAVLEEIDQNHTQTQELCGGVYYWAYVVGSFAVIDFSDFFEIWI
jgi:hypothetical protein